MATDLDNPVRAWWVIGRVNKGSPAGKKILAHAAQGVGYYMLDESLFGFLWTEYSGPLSHHLQLATPKQAIELDSRWRGRPLTDEEKNALTLSHHRKIKDPFDD